MYSFSYTCPENTSTREEVYICLVNDHHHTVNVHCTLCTLGCGIFFKFSSTLHKILILRAFSSPRQGDFKTVFFFLRRIFLEYSGFKVWEPL